MTIPIFRTQHTYPDFLDLQRIAKYCKSKKTDAELADLFQQFCRAFFWIQFVRANCWNHGKHELLSVEELQRAAEPMIGTVSSEAFRLALAENNAAKTLKFPPLDRLGEFSDWWNEWIAKH